MRKKTEPMHFEQKLYPSFVDAVVAMNKKNRERLSVRAFEYNGV